MASFSTRNLLTSTLLAFANKAARRNLNTFHQWNNSSSFTRRYVQSNIETRGTVIIQKQRTGLFFTALFFTWYSSKMEWLVRSRSKYVTSLLEIFSLQTLHLKKKVLMCSRIIRQSWVSNPITFNFTNVHWHFKKPTPDYILQVIEYVYLLFIQNISPFLISSNLLANSS